MLEALRKGTGSWLAKIFIGFLVLSFAVWGIADIFGGYGRQSLAQVGGTKIGTEDYRFALRTEMRRLSQQLGRSLTMEDARSAGLDRRVLFRLIGDAAVESHGNELKLSVSEQHLAERIMMDPAFRGPTGEFDRLYFQQILSTNGLNEQVYVARQRKASVRRQLMRTVTETPQLPKTLLKAVNTFENEKLTLRYITAPTAKAGAIGTPSDADLKGYYENNKRNFTSRELRKLGLLILDPEELAKAIDIGADELKAYYEANQNAYLKAERRWVHQIPFSNKAAADAAYQRFKNGTDFLALATEQGLSERDIDLGLVSKKDLVDPVISKAAFSMKKDGVSAPIVGRLATAIIRVTEVEPEVKMPFETVKKEIAKRLATDRAANDILDLHDRIEDERAGGATISEIAARNSISYLEIGAIDDKGGGPNGNPVDEIPVQDQLLKIVFEGDVGVEMDPIETENQGFVWVDVLEVKGERVKPLEEVRDQVVKGWRAQQIRSKLAELGKALVGRMRNGETLDAVAASLNLTVRKAPPVTRLIPSDTIPRAAIAQAFVLREGNAGSASAPDGKTHLIFKVVKIKAPPPLSSEAAAKIEARINMLLSDDYFSQYLTGLRNAFGVTINEAAVNQITGRDR